jgi:aminopeptidase N
VLGNIATESESTTIRTTLSQLSMVARVYVDPSTRTETIALVGDSLWALAQGAAAGSDAQFQFVKFFANIASTSAHVVAVRSLRDGTSALEGLAIDTDLSWELLEALVLNGAAGHSEIDEALAADNTASGAQAAARARATIPTAAGKLAVFASLVDSDDAPNSIVRNSTVGFSHTNDPNSLEPIMDRYFASLVNLWKSRSYQIAETLIVGLYPSALASQELIDATNAWLASNQEVPALRRLVIENLAGVERAVRVQNADRA